MAIGQPVRPPRAWAAEIIDAWIDRRPTADIMQRVPEHLQPLVRALANNARAMILHHADHPLMAPCDGKPWKLAGLYRTIVRYKSARL